MRAAVTLHVAVQTRARVRLLRWRPEIRGTVPRTFLVHTDSERGFEENIRLSGRIPRAHATIPIGKLRERVSDPQRAGKFFESDVCWRGVGFRDCSVSSREGEAQVIAAGALEKGGAVHSCTSAVKEAYTRIPVSYGRCTHSAAPRPPPRSPPPPPPEPHCYPLSHPV